MYLNLSHNSLIEDLYKGTEEMQNGKKVKLTKRKPTRGASKMKLEKTDYEPDADDKREKEKLYLFEDELAESS